MILANSVSFGGNRGPSDLLRNEAQVFGSHPAHVIRHAGVAARLGETDCRALVTGVSGFAGAALRRDKNLVPQAADILPGPGKRAALQRYAGLRQRALQSASGKRARS